MPPSSHRSAVPSDLPLVETLESRRVFSAGAPAALLNAAVPMPATAATATTILKGTPIFAEAGQPFAVIGTITNFPGLPAGYSLQGRINWGDSTPTSPAKFLRQPDGSIAVLGDHTYATPGTDDIFVQVTANPPPWSAQPVRLVGSFHSPAKVLDPNGGVTLNATADSPFADTLGFFHSNLSSLNMTAVIDWGDGSRSLGRILALPTAGPIPTFAVVGKHSYDDTGSYLVHITVYSAPPTTTPIAATDPFAPPAIVVAEIHSVIDVLPILPSVTVA